MASGLSHIQGEHVLRLHRSTVTALIGWASKHPEVEVCGLVWGTQTFQTVHPLKNVHPEPAKYYRTEPAELRAAFNRMDDEGGEPVAWYHSHPGGKPDPSEEDMAGAFDIGMYYLILFPEHTELTAGLGQVIGRATHWQFTVWECLEPGILVQASYEVVP